MTPKRPTRYRDSHPHRAVTSGGLGTRYTVGFDHNVYALDADSGAERWRFSTGGHVWSSPAVAGRTVYVGSADESVYAIHEPSR